MAAPAARLVAVLTSGTPATTPAQTTAASAAFVVLVSWELGNISSVTDNKSNSYSLVRLLEAGGWKSAVYVCVAGTGGASHAATVTFSQAPGGASVHFVEITDTTGLGVSPAPSYDTSSPFTAASGALSVPDELLLSFCASNNGGPYSIGGDWDRISTQENVAYWTSAVAVVVAESTSSVTASWTDPGASAAHVHVLSFLPAPPAVEIVEAGTAIAVAAALPVAITQTVTVAAQVGAAAAAGLQAAISTGASVAAGTSRAVARGVTATVGATITIVASVGRAVARGMQAGIAIGGAIAAGVGQATASGRQAAIRLRETLVVSTGAAVARGLPAVLGGTITIAAATGTAVASGLSATVGTGGTIECGVGAAIARSPAAAISQHQVIAATTAHARAAGLPATIGEPTMGPYRATLSVSQRGASIAASTRGATITRIT